MKARMEMKDGSVVKERKPKGFLILPLLGDKS